MPTMIGITVQLDVSQDIETTYDWIVDVNTPIKMVRSRGPVPGFKSYTLLDGDWKHEGAKRRVLLNDGSTLTESIKTIKRPDYFDYELTDIKDSTAARILLRRGYGQWWFQTTNSGTHVKWRYAFEAKHPLLTPLLWLFMHTLYRSFMKAAMRKMKHFSLEENLNLR